VPALEDNAERLLSLISPAPVLSEPATLAESGKATLPDAEGPASVTLTLKGKAAGKVQVGPAADATGGYEVPVEIPAATQQTQTLRVPRGWSIKTTLAEGSIAKGIVTPV
jgi:hypothetical protein